MTEYATPPGLLSTLRSYTIDPNPGEQVKDLHAKIGELAVANDFLARKLKPWTGK